MPQLVALLKGINVGPHKRIAMADLRELLEGLGYGNVRTHLQSGNAVLASADDPEDVARAIEREIEKQLGLSVDVVVRTGGQLGAIAAANPLADVADDPAKHLVVFLSEEPDQAALGEVDQDGLLPERFAVRGSDLYVWCPCGINKSPLLKELTHKRVASTATARNWRTVEKLLEMAREEPA